MKCNIVKLLAVQQLTHLFS